MSHQTAHKECLDRISHIQSKINELRFNSSNPYRLDMIDVLNELLDHQHACLEVLDAIAYAAEQIENANELAYQFCH